jgi:peroxiredoxin
MRKIIGESIMRNFYSILAAVGVAMCLSLIVGADAPVPAGAKIGDAAPNFSLSDQDGNIVDLSKFAGKVVILEWTNPDCPFVQDHYKKHTMFNLAAQYEVKGAVWLSIDSSHDDTNAYNKKWAEEQGLFYPVLNDASGAVGHAYGATNTPNMYVINRQGKLVYKGAIDNNPDGTMGAAKINYVANALAEVVANKPVAIPETKAYGCAVKYSN